jgi:Tfp pilus assembly protein FimV
MPEQQQQVVDPNQQIEDFDPEAIMSEIVQKDMENQQKEQGLAQHEEQLGQMEQALQQKAEELAQAEEQIAAAHEEMEAAQPVPLAPAKPAAGKKQELGDISPQTMKNVQPGHHITVSKKMMMTEDGPQEIGRTENIKPPKENAKPK